MNKSFGCRIFFDIAKIAMYNVMYIIQFIGGTNMAQMIRKQVYIEPAQDSILKQRARMMGIKEAEVIRRAIDRQMALLGPGFHDLEAWEREKVYIAERMAGGSVSGGRKFRREDAYKERLERYGR